MLALLSPACLVTAAGSDEALVAAWLLFTVCICSVQIPLLAFWIWMIVDCARNEKSEGNERLIWILVIVLASWIGALIYFFARRGRRIRELGR